MTIIQHAIAIKKMRNANMTVDNHSCTTIASTLGWQQMCRLQIHAFVSQGVATGFIVSVVTMVRKSCYKDCVLVSTQYATKRGASPHPSTPPPPW